MVAHCPSLVCTILHSLSAQWLLWVCENGPSASKWQHNQIRVHVMFPCPLLSSRSHWPPVGGPQVSFDTALGHQISKDKDQHSFSACSLSQEKNRSSPKHGTLLPAQVHYGACAISESSCPCTMVLLKKTFQWLSPILFHLSCTHLTFFWRKCLNFHLGLPYSAFGPCVWEGFIFLLSLLQSWHGNKFRIPSSKAQ